jgi:acyl-coenzyme A thioesterase PaaI-like protein
LARRLPVRKHFHPGSLRPGGTLSGPTMMALADFGIYVAILATVGWVPAAVTTNLNINFLKKRRGTSWPRRA